MATRRRTLLFLCALGVGAALVPTSPVLATSAQDPGATFGGTEAPITTTTVAATSTTEASQTNQTLVESEEAPDQPVFTENRKVAAVIGGLVLVALALLLLTVRYIRVTKPSSSDDVEPGIPMLPPDLDLNDDSVFVDEPDGWAAVAPATPATPVAAEEPSVTEPADVDPAAATLAAEAPTAADHDAADDDWEPRTGEHERVEIPRGTTLVRPGLAARRKALGVD